MYHGLLYLLSGGQVTCLGEGPEISVSSFLAGLGSADMTDMCNICGFDTEPENLIVYCEKCNMGVHQTCYGIPKVRTSVFP